jgi:hypothetical protein
MAADPMAAFAANPTFAESSPNVVYIRKEGVNAL